MQKRRSIFKGGNEHLPDWESAVPTHPSHTDVVGFRTSLPLLRGRMNSLRGSRCRYATMGSVDVVVVVAFVVCCAVARAFALWC